jgi:NADPH:quinone reductase-like Zn-dependent oxidoreductase
MRLTGAARPVLTEADIPQPTPGPEEVLIRVAAAGVITTEPKWYPTWHTKEDAPRDGAVPCHEFSGEIAESGEQIYGMNDWYADGALAEYCITRPEWIAPKPESLTHTRAASAPISALTAWQGLFDRARLQRGERVLIHGGAGAVGVFAIQLAHRQGAEVATTVSPRNAQFVRDLGADQVIDYKAIPFEKEAGEVDVVFDAVGGDTLRRSWSVLKPGGRLVTITSDEIGPDERTRAAFFIVEPKREQLVEIGRLLDAGEIRTVIDTVVPFSRASDAFNGNLQRTGRGKLVVTVRDRSE